MPAAAATETAEPSEDTAHHRAVLRDCIDLGRHIVALTNLEVAAAIKQAEARLADPDPETAPAKPAPDFTGRYNLLTRAIRLTVLLDERLANPAPPPPPPEDPDRRRVAARKAVLREVDDAIHRHAKPAEAETLRDELTERMDMPDFDAELLDRPTKDVVAEIKRDLGLANGTTPHPFKRRTPDDLFDIHLAALKQPPAPQFTLREQFPPPRTVSTVPTPTVPASPAPPPAPPKRGSG